MRARATAWSAAAVLAAVLAAGGTAYGAAFTNGSFESGNYQGTGALNTLYWNNASSTAITGWTVTAGDLDWIWTDWTAEDGSYSLDMTGCSPGTIAQTFDTVAGTQYLVKLYLAGNPGGNAIKHLAVAATGNPTAYCTFDVSGHSSTSMGWELETYEFHATGTNTTLSFQSLDDNTCAGPALDNVSVEVARRSRRPPLRRSARSPCSSPRSGGWLSAAAPACSRPCIDTNAGEGSLVRSVVRSTQSPSRSG